MYISSKNIFLFDCYILLNMNPLVCALFMLQKFFDDFFYILDLTCLCAYHKRIFYHNVGKQYTLSNAMPLYAIHDLNHTLKSNCWHNHNYQGKLFISLKWISLLNELEQNRNYSMPHSLFPTCLTQSSLQRRIQETIVSPAFPFLCGC